MRMLREQHEQKYEGRQKRLFWNMQGAWPFGSLKSDTKALEESWAFFSIGRDLITQ